MNTARLMIVAVVSLPLVQGCMTTPPRKGNPMEEITKVLSDGRKDAAERPVVIPPPAISSALMPAIDLDLGMQGSEEVNRFDVQVSGVQAREFFMGLVEDTPYNMVVHPDVKGQISLSLKNVTIPEVMQTLRDVYGYEFNQTRAGFQVLPVRLQSRVFYVNYLNMKRSGSSEMTVSSGQISQNVSGSAESSSTVTENQTSAQISTRTEADVWGELRQALEHIVGKQAGRSVVVSPQSGIVVVRAMPAELREIENFLRETQDSLHRQVILEAKIIEVELSDGSQTGINWSKVASSDSGYNSITLGQTGGGTVLGGNNLTGIAGQTGQLNPTTYSAVNSTTTSAFGGVFTAAIKLGSFSAFLEMLKTEGNVQVLSSPRVATMNNQKAVIKVGRDEFFVTDVSSTTTTSSGASTSTPDITLTPFFSGIALDVTPQIGKDGGVTLHVHPSVSEVTDSTKTLTIDGKTQSLPLALSTVRESDSIVHARSGQLVVIGGLMKNTVTEKQAATPILGDLPFIGAAFRQNKQVAVKSELVILLKPIVVDSPQDWQRSLSSSEQRIRNLEKGFHVGASPEVFGNEAERQ